MSIVAIVGRPNVGKSTLFNRLVGMRQAIVDDVSGVTRDRHYGNCEWCGREFSVIDTGGYTTNSDDVFESAIRQQVEIAIDESDVVLFLVEAATGVTDYDAGIADVLRRSRKHRSNVLQAGPLSFDTAGGSVSIDGQELALSRKEFEILLLLASEPGRSFSRNEILQQVWGAVPYVLERTVDVHIARIRAKLGEKRALVQNRQGFGYSLELDRDL